MDKLKKLEDSVENLKKLEHSMGLIFQQLKNLENSIASSAVPSAPQAIISAPMSSYAVPSASISSAVPSAMLIKLNFLKKRVFPAFQPNIRDFYKSTLTK
ncbi:uncharacterized protein LOC136094725 isoform X10 [Hydra vulgaris]|uniref:uncharacterized protein LOC136094725 isoform X10 n=2 Tax=Hydra vulgaris TaxID=6087 RepID=UPI0032E9E13C